MVHENIATALILEDDINWDVNIRLLMPKLAQAVHALTHESPEGVHHDPSWLQPLDRAEPVDIPLDAQIIESRFSPYGDVWEMLWLGHCAAGLTDNEPSKYPRGRVSWQDESVPSHQYINYNMGHLLLQQYPNHTRVIHHSRGNVCTFGYAVTQAMARRLLWHLSVRTMQAPIDLEYASMCEGRWTDAAPRCYTSEPPYFTMFRPKGDVSLHSDIDDSRAGVQAEDFEPNVRYGVMGNIDNWVEGRPLRDVAPDEGWRNWK
jgi:hypothetical protein